MAAYLSPVGNEQQSDANGAPLSGGLIYSYAAGTSTPIATYTGSDGLTAQANPVVLNSSGLPDSPIWLPAGQAVKLVIKDADGVTLRTVDNLTGINDPAGVAQASEWVTYTGDPTYINATSFSVEGDQTGVLQVGRRLRSTNTGGVVYSTISAASYDVGSGLTTVTVVNDSGALDSGLSVVAFGLLSVTNPSNPSPVTVGTAVAAAGQTSIDFTGIPATAKRVKVMFDEASLSGTSAFLVQLGDSGGIETTGYKSTAIIDNAGTTNNSTAGFQVVTTGAAASTLWRGALTLDLFGSNIWVGTSTMTRDGGAAYSSGRKALSATLTQVRIATVNGTDTFDAGSVNVSWE